MLYYLDTVIVNYAVEGYPGRPAELCPCDRKVAKGSTCAGQGPIRNLQPGNLGEVR